METDDFLKVLNILEDSELSSDDLSVIEDALFDEFGAMVIDGRPDEKVVELKTKVKIGVFQIGAAWKWLTIDTWNDLNMGKGPDDLQRAFDLHVGRPTQLSIDG